MLKDNRARKSSRRAAAVAFLASATINQIVQRQFAMMAASRCPQIAYQAVRDIQSIVQSALQANILVAGTAGKTWLNSFLNLVHSPDFVTERPTHENVLAKVPVVESPGELSGSHFLRYESAKTEAKRQRDAATLHISTCEAKEREWLESRNRLLQHRQAAERDFCHSAFVSASFNARRAAKQAATFAQEQGALAIQCVEDYIRQQYNKRVAAFSSKQLALLGDTRATEEESNRKLTAYKSGMHVKILAGDLSAETGIIKAVSQTAFVIKLDSGSMQVCNPIHVEQDFRLPAKIKLDRQQLEKEQAEAGQQGTQLKVHLGMKRSRRTYSQILQVEVGLYFSAVYTAQQVARAAAEHAQRHADLAERRIKQVRSRRFSLQGATSSVTGKSRMKAAAMAVMMGFGSKAPKGIVEAKNTVTTDEAVVAANDDEIVPSDHAENGQLERFMLSKSHHPSMDNDVDQRRLPRYTMPTIPSHTRDTDPDLDSEHPFWYAHRVAETVIIQKGHGGVAANLSASAPPPHTTTSQVPVMLRDQLHAVKPMMLEHQIAADASLYRMRHEICKKHLPEPRDKSEFVLNRRLMQSTVDARTTTNANLDHEQSKRSDEEALLVVDAAEVGSAASFGLKPIAETQHDLQLPYMYRAGRALAERPLAIGVRREPLSTTLARPSGSSHAVAGCSERHPFQAEVSSRRPRMKIKSTVPFELRILNAPQATEAKL